MAHLIISRSHSYCGKCRDERRFSGASPAETGHYTLLGYGTQNGDPGCGEKWDSWFFDFFYTDETYMQGLVDSMPELYPALKGVPYGGISE